MLVTDRLVGTPVLVRIDPVTGAQTTVSAGGLFFAPVDARSTDGDVLVADVDAVNFEGAVFRSGSIL
jgi:hypothetical protein